MKSNKEKSRDTYSTGDCIIRVNRLCFGLGKIVDDSI